MKKFEIIIIISLVAVLGMLWYIDKQGGEVNNPPESSEGAEGEALRVSFLDIGQGDASFIEFSDGQQMLVDCSYDARIIEALGRVMDFYDKTIDYLVVTHQDSDHYGGCIDVMKRFQVLNIVYNGLKKEGDNYWNYFNYIMQEEIKSGAIYHEINKPEGWDVAGASVNFLYPDHSISENASVPGAQEANANDTSIVMKVEYGSKSILLTGDAGLELENYLIGRYGEDLDVDVLKVGHHGSESSSGVDFLSIVSPEISIISVGGNNEFGHPSRRVLKRLERMGGKIWRTDVESDIIIDIKKDRVYVKND